MSKIYLNIHQRGKHHLTETVGQFNSFKEAVKMRYEKQLSDTYNYYYLSQRCTNNWKHNQ